MCCLRKYSLRTPDIKKRIAKYKPKNIRMSNKAWIIRIKFSITVQALMPLHFMSNSSLFVISDCSSSNEKRKIRCTAPAATLLTRWSLTPPLYWTSWALIGWMKMPIPMRGIMNLVSVMSQVHTEKALNPTLHCLISTKLCFNLAKVTVMSVLVKAGECRMSSECFWNQFDISGKDWYV